MNCVLYIVFPVTRIEAWGQILVTSTACVSFGASGSHYKRVFLCQVRNPAKQPYQRFRKPGVISHLSYVIETIKKPGVMTFLNSTSKIHIFQPVTIISILDR